MFFSLWHAKRLFLYLMTSMSQNLMKKMFLMCRSRLEKEAAVRCGQKEREHLQRFVHWTFWPERLFKDQWSNDSQMFTELEIVILIQYAKGVYQTNHVVLTQMDRDGDVLQAKTWWDKASLFFFLAVLKEALVSLPPEQNFHTVCSASQKLNFCFKLLHLCST